MSQVLEEMESQLAKAENALREMRAAETVLEADLGEQRQDIRDQVVYVDDLREALRLLRSGLY